MNKNKTIYYGHTLKDVTDESLWETLPEHLDRVAIGGREMGTPIGFPYLCYFLGKNHDIGKACIEFLQRLRGLVEHADHSTAALIEIAKYFAKLFPKVDTHTANVLKCILAAVVGHHGGIKELSEACNRFNKKVSYDASLFEKCPQIKQEIIALTKVDPKFSLSVMIRMIYSVLVDADGLATEEFMDKNKSLTRQDRIATFKSWEEYRECFMSRYNTKFSNVEQTIINQCRKRVFEDCGNAASLSPGFFLLRAPTGLAKTLGFLNFATKHALIYNKRRIIVITPFNSIIEQNAHVAKMFFGHSSVLEHHSDYDYRSIDDNGNKEGFDLASKILTTNWNSPIVATSFVQFFESLFSNRVSKCRKLHNLKDAIIILDEFQSAPPDLVKPILKILETLKNEWGATVVFSTATPPPIKHSPWLEFGLKNVREIIENPKELYDKIKRAKTIVIKGTLSYKQLVKKMHSSYKKHGQVLCISNYKKHADSIAEILQKRGFKTYYLSTDLTPIDKCIILRQIRTDLDLGIPFFCITTPIIEAGVDVDFPVVYRQRSGLDSVMQARGRCNRHGKRPMGYFYCFRLKEKDPSNLFDLQTLIANTVLAGALKGEGEFELVSKYMERYYFAKKHSKHAMDKYDIIDACARLNFPEMAKFRIIDQNMIAVVCPHDQYSQRLVEEFKITDSPWKYFRRLQRYTISLYPNRFEALKKAANVLEVNEIFIIDPRDTKDVYNSFVGLSV